MANEQKSLTQRSSSLCRSEYNFFLNQCLKLSAYLKPRYLPTPTYLPPYLLLHRSTSLGKIDLQKLLLFSLLFPHIISHFANWPMNKEPWKLGNCCSQFPMNISFGPKDFTHNLPKWSQARSSTARLQEQDFTSQNGEVTALWTIVKLAVVAMKLTLGTLHSANQTHLVWGKSTKHQKVILWLTTITYIKSRMS